ncbi:MAG TPA: ComEC/Rec2 family competence protein, partial [Anaerolineales bacterium]|nr:ComEC/Rec2 family competence protein [Anaerolineales bacterium]
MPLLWISLSFLAGIVLAASIFLPTWAWALAALVFLLLSILVRVFRLFTRFSFLSSRLYLLILPVVFFLGSSYYQFRQPKIDAFHIAFYNDRNYELLITGYLVEPPDYRDTYTNLTLNVEAVDTGDGDLPVSGQLLVRVSPNEEYVYGERIRLRGTLKTPPENEEFSYRDYLARQGIHSYMTSAEVTRLPGNGGNPLYRAVYRFKSQLIENTYRLY